VFKAAQIFLHFLIVHSKMHQKPS